jgi:hypothetical protein
MSKADEAMKRLKEEIKRLRQEHSDATRGAVFFGMTREEAKTHERRREEMNRLYEELALLEKSRGKLGMR